MIPNPRNASTGFTNVMRKRVRTCYREAGIGPIYQRGKWARGLKVKPAPIAAAASKIDWYGLERSL